MNKRLGRNPSEEKDLNRRLKLENYFSLLPIPAATTWRNKASKSLATVLGNDVYGDCVVVAGAHCTGVTSANTHLEKVYTTKEITDIYFYLSGGRDNGLNMLYFLKYWKATGIIGEKCGPYLAVPNDWDKICAAISVFGPVFAAFAPVPNAWMESEIWDFPSRGAGGHAIAMVDYDKDYIYISTWGDIRKLTRNGLSIFDELYIVLDTDWIAKAPNGFNAHQLLEDFNALGGNDVVPPDPNPDPNPEPPGPVNPPPPPPKPDLPPFNWKSLLDLFLAILELFKKK